MPITSDNYKKFEDWLTRAKKDPIADQSKIGRIETELRSFYEGESSGALPSSGQSDRRPGIAGYYYEPSLDEFHSAIKNPEVYKQIGSPELNLSQQGDKSSGAAYIESKVPELAALNKTDTEHLGEESPEYKSYSDYAYNQEKAKNPDLKRYNDLEITQNPFKKSLGAAIKYGAPAALGAEKSIGLGLPRRAAATIAGNNPDSAADISYDPMGAPQGEYHPEKAEAVMKGAKQLESLSPTANFIGNAAGYAAPIAPANLAARGMMAGLGYETAGALTKAAISGLTGSAVASGEGAAQDVIENPGISGQQLLSNTIPRAVTGLSGALLDPIAQLAGRTQTAFEESPRWAPIKNQKDIGGNTNFVTGIETSPGVRENVRQGALGRENKTPQDIAAMKVAPQIRDSVDNQLTSEASKINKQIEDYTKSPEGLEQHSADPAVDRLLAMAEKGTVSMPVSGKVVSANRPAAETIRKNLQEFADFAHVSPEEAQSITEQHGGRILSNNQANILGLPQENGKVHVVVPGKFNAEALLKKEDQIASNLKYDTKEGGVDNPVLQEMNQAFKEIRDKFKYGGESQSSPSAINSEAGATGIQSDSMVPSSIAKEPTELAPKRPEAEVRPPKPAQKFGPELETFNPRRSDPNFRYSKEYKAKTPPEEHRLNVEQYKADEKAISAELSSGKDVRKREEERLLKWAAESAPVQRPYITKEGLDRELARREWGSPKGEPDKNLTKEIYDLVENEAAKKFGITPGEADARNSESSVVDLNDSEFQEAAPPVKAPGAESKLDAELLKRDIGDQAKLEGVDNPLENSTNPNKDHSEKATNPTQLTATLDDGTVVYGFSALRRKQHEALKALEEAKKGTGAATKEGAHNRALAFKSGEGHPYQDEQLAQEADRLGIRQQLEEVPATREYPGLRARAFMGGGEGPINTLKDIAGFRLDPVLGAIAGETRNPYTPLPNTPAGRIQQYLFRQGVPMYPLLEQRGGIGAARFADDYADRNRDKNK